MRNLLLRAALVAMVLMVSVSFVSAQNVLVNPSFESGLTGWTPFGNAFAEAANPPIFVPLTGTGLASRFGNFWGIGAFNVTGIFQEFATTPGAEWTLSSNARHYSGDPMVGEAGTGNWVVQKIAWFDGGGAEIGGVESTILDGTYTPDMWHASGDVVGIAPMGTVKLQALILYLQPDLDGGAAHIDDVSLTLTDGPVPVENSNWGKIKALYGE